MPGERPDLPDLWDAEAVQKWLDDQMNEALLDLLTSGDRFFRDAFNQACA
jgi:hypothetical protein